MISRQTIYISLATLLVVLLVRANAATAQNVSATNLLEKRLDNIEIIEANLHLALSRLSEEYGIPIGVEVVKGGNKGPKIALRMKDGTVQEVLDALVRQDARYNWSLDENVINVTPNSERDVFLRDLLDAKIRTFSITENGNTFDLRMRIVELPEVKTRLNQAGIQPRVSAYTNADTAALGDRFTLTMSNVTLRNILNEIVKSETSEAKYWVVTRLRDHAEYFIVNFSVFEGPIQKRDGHESESNQGQKESELGCFTKFKGLADENLRAP